MTKVGKICSDYILRKTLKNNGGTSETTSARKGTSTDIEYQNVQLCV